MAGPTATAAKGALDLQPQRGLQISQITDSDQASEVNATGNNGRRRAALLVIDMQEHFRKGMAELLVSKLNALMAVCQEHGVPVVLTQHGHLSPTEEERMSVLVAWWGAEGSIKYGSTSWQLLPELHPPPNSHLITCKRTYDAFQGTDLAEFLSAHAIDTLIIGGVMSNLCCETTARSAFTKNFNVMFLSDGTATASEAMHQASLVNMGYGFARVMTCKEAKQWVAENCRAGGANL